MDGSLAVVSTCLGSLSHEDRLFVYLISAANGDNYHYHNNQSLHSSCRQNVTLKQPIRRGQRDAPLPATVQQTSKSKSKGSLLCLTILLLVALLFESADACYELAESEKMGRISSTTVGAPFTRPRRGARACDLFSRIPAAAV